ncbi:LLM class flavin-dependent oxidoreductase [Rhodococcus sp. 06-621-2]|nr:NtaA/DmoA family FMN-dependent monooxygenase [Rhodococcus sp. 06-621-2]OZC55478.1 LLM class flavin-dependent oxidoreductase [Rhodococcus sp. 06-621-2]
MTIATVDRELHLCVNITYSGKHEAAWRTAENPRAIVDVDYYRAIARTAERGAFDAVLIPDTPALPSNASETPWNAMEPSILLTAIGSVVDNIGLIGTASTTFNEPFNLARRFASLDHVTSGRGALNVVTTMNAAAAANFGLRTLPDRAERYSRAAEFVEILVRLWESWDEGAFLAEQSSGRFVDMARVRSLDHVGDRFSVRGPLNVPRSPQGRPVLFQAGDGGRAMAARFADAVFTAQTVRERAQEFRASLRAEAQRVGRRPEDVAVMPGLLVIVGSTEREAMERKDELDVYLDPHRELTRLAHRLGLEPDDLSLDEPIPVEAVRSRRFETSRAFHESTVALAIEEKLTVRQLLARNPGAHRLVVGTPEQVADDMELWFRSNAADGFVLNANTFPSGLEDFVDHVVPELRRRGIFRNAYTGTTLRHHLGATL